MRTFNVTVNGKAYQVQVEETTGAIESAQPVAPQPSRGGILPPVSPTPPVPAEQPKPVAAPIKPDFSDATGEPITAPMPGAIVSVPVSAGQAVAKYDVLCVLEAMKMENEIVAPRDGTVTAVLVSKGDAVSSGDKLVLLA